MAAGRRSRGRRRPHRTAWCPRMSGAKWIVPPSLLCCQKVCSPAARSYPKPRPSSRSIRSPFLDLCRPALDWEFLSMASSHAELPSTTACATCLSTPRRFTKQRDVRSVVRAGAGALHTAPLHPKFQILGDCCQKHAAMHCSRSGNHTRDRVMMSISCSKSPNEAQQESHPLNASPSPLDVSNS